MFCEGKPPPSIFCTRRWRWLGGNEAKVVERFQAILLLHSGGSLAATRTSLTRFRYATNVQHHHYCIINCHRFPSPIVGMMYHYLGNITESQSSRFNCTGARNPAFSAAFLPASALLRRQSKCCSINTQRNVLKELNCSRGCGAKGVHRNRGRELRM